MLHYSDLMTRYRGRIRSEEPSLQSDRSARASLVEPPERKHVFVSSVVGKAPEALLAQNRTNRVGPMPLMPAAGARLIDSDEGRGG